MITTAVSVFTVSIPVSITITTNSSANNLAEIEIYADAQPTVNIASRATVTMDSQAGSQVAAFCVDGNVNTYCSTQSSARGINLFFSPGAGRIVRIRLINRQDCCQANLAGATISIVEYDFIGGIGNSHVVTTQSTANVTTIDVNFAYPTTAPTRSPTTSPTPPTTSLPTQSPSRAPTKSPSKAPSRSPTIPTTQVPTASPIVYATLTNGITVFDSFSLIDSGSGVAPFKAACTSFLANYPGCTNISPLLSYRNPTEGTMSLSTRFTSPNNSLAVRTGYGVTLANAYSTFVAGPLILPLSLIGYTTPPTPFYSLSQTTGAIDTTRDCSSSGTTSLDSTSASARLGDMTSTSSGWLNVNQVVCSTTNNFPTFCLCQGKIRPQPGKLRRIVILSKASGLLNVGELRAYVAGGTSTVNVVSSSATTVSMSSTSGAQSAGLCTDGDINTYCSTNSETNPYITFDLGFVDEITYVIVFNRQDAGQSNLNGATISFAETTQGNVYYTTTLSGTANSYTVAWDQQFTFTAASTGALGDIEIYTSALPSYNIAPLATASTLSPTCYDGNSGTSCTLTGGTDYFLSFASSSPITRTGRVSLVRLKAMTTISGVAVKVVISEKAPHMPTFSPVYRRNVATTTPSPAVTDYDYVI